MTDALKRASAASSRSYLAAKASVGQAVESMLANAGGSGLIHRPDLMQSAEQIRSNRGWVRAAIRPISQRIAGQPIRVGTAKAGSRTGTKAAADVKPLDSHPLLDLLADPNDLGTAWGLIDVTVQLLELTGRCLWWLPQRKQILPIPTTWLVGFEGTTKITAFKVRPPHSAEPWMIPADECAYFHYPHPGDPHGAFCPLMAVASAVNADEEMDRSQAAMFRQRINPVHAIIVGRDVESKRRPRLTGAQQRQIITAIKKRYGGAVNHHDPLILDGLIEDVKRLSNTPAEMDWLDSGKVTKEKILLGFGVNEIIIGSKEANRASAASADKHFCQYTVNPKIELLSQCLTEWLAPMFGGDIVVWIEPCVSNDSDTVLKSLNVAAKYSVITGDELRALLPGLGLGPAGLTDMVTPQPRDRQTDEATAMLREAMADLKRFEVPGYVNRIADQIVGGNGKA